jgi:hypothetical protein
MSSTALLILARLECILTPPQGLVLLYVHMHDAGTKFQSFCIVLFVYTVPVELLNLGACVFKIAEKLQIVEICVGTKAVSGCRFRCSHDTDTAKRYTFPSRYTFLKRSFFKFPRNRKSILRFTNIHAHILFS